MFMKAWKLSRLLLAAGALLVISAPHTCLAWTSDNRDGTFTNHVLNSDYPDPDIIRVGGDFYLVTTTFVSVPGLEILHSRDLINWQIVGYAARTLDIDPKYSLIGGSEYAQGVWAPSLRFHNGTFYIVDNIQGAGTVVYRASRPEGPWTMNRLNGSLFDPGLMFDGRADTSRWPSSTPICAASSPTPRSTPCPAASAKAPTLTRSTAPIMSSTPCTP
jgi:hypothetical protein